MMGISISSSRSLFSNTSRLPTSTSILIFNIMSSCSNGCDNCAINLNDYQKLAQFGPEIVVKAVKDISVSMGEIDDEKVLDKERTLIRCDGSILLHTADLPTSQPDLEKRRFTSKAFVSLSDMLVGVREILREKARAENSESYQGFCLLKLLSILTPYCIKLSRGHKLINKDYLEFYTVEVITCYDVYWENSLSNIN